MSRERDQVIHQIEALYSSKVWMHSYISDEYLNKLLGQDSFAEEAYARIIEYQGKYKGCLEAANQFLSLFEEHKDILQDNLHQDMYKYVLEKVLEYEAKIAKINPLHAKMLGSPIIPELTYSAFMLAIGAESSAQDVPAPVVEWFGKSEVIQQIKDLYHQKIVIVQDIDHMSLSELSRHDSFFESERTKIVEYHKKCQARVDAADKCMKLWYQHGRDNHEVGEIIGEIIGGVNNYAQQKCEVSELYNKMRKSRIAPELPEEITAIVVDLRAMAIEMENPRKIVRDYVYDKVDEVIASSKLDREVLFYVSAGGVLYGFDEDNIKHSLYGIVARCRGDNKELLSFSKGFTNSTAEYCGTVVQLRTDVIAVRQKIVSVVDGIIKRFGSSEVVSSDESLEKVIKALMAIQEIETMGDLRRVLLHHYIAAEIGKIIASLDVEERGLFESYKDNIDREMECYLYNAVKRSTICEESQVTYLEPGGIPLEIAYVVKDMRVIISNLIRNARYQSEAESGGEVVQDAPVADLSVEVEKMGVDGDE